MNPTPDDADRAQLDELREEIDALKKIPEEELISPSPTKGHEGELEPKPTDAPGTEDWGETR
ncbi:hypothetical protein NQ156_08835 [Microbacterium sp. zg.Y625]|uniref:hypothetical protein n=1 Tax=Microbacterium jiangjiandongii TaxID=3049071 RepID=UPI00214B1EDC|nr:MULTISPECIES: hypothetical protein [unclassified Microbacterium]MCR2793160.1 hypothetical protein [Microbacterium sp. zg.Y625]MCR2817183.1 hypothetical protein [Microbacterium sp. zg.Y843]WIM24267.1 hypothetical protein QNO14_08860 [Microbacterium sp. zg-Y625]